MEPDNLYHSKGKTHHVAKKATDVVAVVSNIPKAASGKAIIATSSVDAIFPSLKRTCLNFSTATNKSSAPKAADTKKPIRFKREKNFNPNINR